MKVSGSILMLALCLAAGNVGATVTIGEQVMQKGVFAKAGCQPDPKDTDYDQCYCDADVRYPMLAGMNDAVTQGRLNDWFKEQAVKTVCAGDKATAPKDKTQNAKSHMSVSVHYEVTFSSPKVIGLKFTDWDYTGGAHGDGSVTGVIIDLGTGKLLTPTDIFSAKNLDAVNQSIYDVLAARPEEEIFHEQVEARKGTFIKDGQCQGCTLTLTPEGVHILFQTYEVAPYGAGNADVLIPGKLVTNAAVKSAAAGSAKSQ